MDHMGLGLIRSSSPVLVTGAGGYLGSCVLARLRQQGFPVHGTARGEADFETCDLEDVDATRALIERTGAQTVIHTAAKVPKTADDYVNSTYDEANLLMVKALIAARPGHIVFTSSMTVYVEQYPMPVRESDAPLPADGYGGAKRSAEISLMEAEGVKCTILRLPGLFGPPRDDGLLNNVIKSLHDGTKLRLPDDPPMWAALYVDDAADFCVRSVSRVGEDKCILNAGYPGVFSIAGAVNTLARMFGHPALMSENGPFFEMDLNRLKVVLGLSSHTFEERLTELIRKLGS